MSSPLVRAAFAVLVGATILAFFVTQQLKGEFPLVLRFAAIPSSISPNGDGTRDGTFVGFDLSRRAKVSFYVVDSEGREVRRLVDNRTLAGDTRHRYFWNGRDNDGNRVPDGRYQLRVIRRDEGRVINSIKTIRVDTKRPRVVLTSARPGVIAPGNPGQHPVVRIRYRGPRNDQPEYRIFRTDEGAPRVVARFRGNDRHEALWHGSIRGRPAADGDYTFTVTVRDKAGNPSVAPAEIPTRENAKRGTGVAVRHLTLRGPASAVRPGSLVRLEVGPYRRPFAYSLSRLGAKRAVKSDRRTGGALRVRIPPRSRTGLYYVRVRADGRDAVWPLAVQGAPARRPAPLVVLPAITWQGLNPVDDDLDGFANSLLNSRSIPLARPFVRGAAPRALTTETAPLLRFLDRKRLRYDLTTDVSLRAKDLNGIPGLALAGSARWLTPDSRRELRRYVEDGGRLASFGGDALKRTVQLRGGTLLGPTAAARENALGERTRLTRRDAAPLTVQEDRLGIFAGAGQLGDFSLFDLSSGGRRRLTSAGPDPDQPAFVAYRLGKGIVVRSGTPQWAANLSDPGAAGATEQIWSLLRHR
ncbi:MAG TPA: N,N-dimethylformamidase beta subunit family domain-containing protein [Thermoleophilaceae bacterium]